jgi:hypothetical protein
MVQNSILRGFSYILCDNHIVFKSSQQQLIQSDEQWSKIRFAEANTKQFAFARRAFNCKCFVAGGLAKGLTNNHFNMVGASGSSAKVTPLKSKIVRIFCVKRMGGIATVAASLIALHPAKPVPQRKTQFVSFSNLDVDQDLDQQ